MINIENLQKSYSGIEPVLNIKNLKLNENKIYGLVGPNGSGKTTLFKCMTNIITDYKGVVNINGNNPKENPSTLSIVGLVLDGMNVYHNRTGIFNIKYFSGLKGQYNKEKIDYLAEKLKIKDVLNKKVSMYSYGMKKKLILLIALMNSPKILFMDEPFRGLDLETVDFFKNYLKELHSEGLTLVISSHILEELENFCQEVIVLNQGRLNKILSIEEIKMQELRVINTTDNSRVEEILSIYSIPYKIVEMGIKVDIKDSKWEEVYKEISSNGIMISSMEDVSTLKESINSALRGGNRSEF